ncbi:AAA family ATPase [Streptomyces sp. NBC_01264]|uniref:AAA family ATPase n=1 Tax=Streptomyces sp. NBC_01264 TaxID=2903804 RepID=UPI00225B80CE|nr:AAA family ATPase [Streptomyces sp. NBC_01264]MCX4780115.1 helicase RepA family protein [Streptomyces sp. NBC_01264]
MTTHHEADAPPGEGPWAEHPHDQTEGLTSEQHFENRVAGLIDELLDTDDLDKMPSLEPLLGDLLYLNTLSRVVGPSGQFKSFAVIDMCGHIGTGTPWHGHYVRQGRVVYLVAEGAEGIRKRVRAWEHHHRRKMANVLFLPRPVQAMDPEWEVLAEALHRIEPAFVVVDTQARVTVGVEENSNTEMGKVVDRLERLRSRTGACVLVIHHTGHIGEHGRGATAVKGALQTELHVSKKGDKTSNTVVTIKSGKQKDEDTESDLQFGLKIVAIPGEAKPDGRPVTSVVLVPREEVDVQELAYVEGSIEWIVRQLDIAEVPNDWGRDRVLAKCTELDLKVGKDKAASVVRVRKARGVTLPASLPGPDLLTPALGQGAGPDETADQTCPGQDEGRSGQAPNQLPAPSSFPRRGQVVELHPECIVCHTALDAAWASLGNDRHVAC